MRRLMFFLTLAIVAALAYLMMRTSSTPQQSTRADSAGSVARPVATSSVLLAASAAPDSAAVGVPQVPPARDFESELKNSNDYAQFARDALAAARAGDHIAQYQLARALKYCADGYRFYFDRGSRRRTIDEALAWASTRASTDVEEVRQVYARCEGLKDPEQRSTFGAADQWLTEAANGGVDLAKIEIARGLALEAGNSGTKENVARRNEAKRLLIDAIRSKDPRVIWEVGDMAALLVGDQEKATSEQWVWRLAACQRGFDCGPNASWLKVQCRFDLNCQPYDSGEDYIRRRTSNTFEEIRQRATELNKKLDEGQYENLGI